MALTRTQRELLHEMAKEERVIFPQKNPGVWMGIRYTMNSFPMREIRPSIIKRLAEEGCICLDRRGYFTLTAKGQLVGSVIDSRKR